VTRAEWSGAVEQAAWIAERLSPFDSGEVTSVVPAGYEAYARLLHPAEGLEGAPGVRWAQVAAWSGVALGPDTQFHELALPEHRPAAPAPWSGHGAAVGTLAAADLDALIEVLAEHTATADSCWFCLWEGYGWDSNSRLIATADEDPAAPAPGMADLDSALDPVPPAVRAGPRVELPNRRHLLYRGPIAAAREFVGSHDQSPTLWWPADRAWCVATEIDLDWTYVGGPSGLIDRLVADQRVEAQRARAGDHHHLRVQPWLARAIDRTTDELFASGQATLHTWRGNLSAQLERPRDDRDGFLRTRCEGEDPLTRPQSGSGWTRLHDHDPDGDALRAAVTSALTIRVIDSLIS